MTPERMAELVARWVRFYTRNLPQPIVERRADEIQADLHDHIAHDRDHGTSEGRIARSIAGRMVRGMAADASWRRRTIARSSSRKDVMKNNKTVHRSAVRIGLVTALVLLVPAAGMLIGDDTAWGVFDFVLAAVLLIGTGALIEMAVRNPGNLALRVGAAGIGIAAIVLGEADDAPGLVLFGCLLIAGTLALTVKTALRSE
jgi:hypothetical protein